MIINGSCHCGNITFELRWEPEPVEIPARTCGCSFCTRHGNVWTSHPAGSLVVSTKDPGRISQYVFGTRTARFHVCRECGVIPVATSEIDGRIYAVVNVNTFDNVAASLLKHASVSFDGEDTESRLARRRRGWIADVHFISI
jgi:hypothetical protein